MRFNGKPQNLAKCLAEFIIFLQKTVVSGQVLGTKTWYGCDDLRSGADESNQRQDGSAVSTCGRHRNNPSDLR